MTRRMLSLSGERVDGQLTNVLRDDDGDQVGIVYQDAHAAHVVACWNACNGTPTERVEEMSAGQSLPELVNYLRGRLDRTEATAEARLDQLDDARNELNRSTRGWEQCKLDCDDLRDALALERRSLDIERTCRAAAVEQAEQLIRLRDAAAAQRDAALAVLQRIADSTPDVEPQELVYENLEHAIGVGEEMGRWDLGSIAVEYLKEQP